MNMEALPPNHRDFSLWARIAGSGASPMFGLLLQSRPWVGARVASQQRSVFRSGDRSL